MPTALFVGRFDPVTLGHLDIAKRAADLFDGLIVGVEQTGNRSAGGPGTLFDTEERVALFAEAIKDRSNVTVMPYRGLTVEFARSHGATVLIRSMRGNTDFDYEFDMALMNRKMAPEIESVYLMASSQYSFLRSSGVKELATFGGNIDDLVPDYVASRLKEELGR